MVLKSSPKWGRIILFTVLVLLLAFVVSWCIYAKRSRNYPYYVANTWQCNDPPFTLTYGKDEYGRLTKFAELEWDNETIEVEIGFLMRECTAFPAGRDILAHSDRLFTGTWRYRNGDFVITIHEDFIFGNQYKELVFSPVS